MITKAIFVFLLAVIIPFSISAQDDLMDMLGSDDPGIQYTMATFKTSRVINSHSIESPAGGTLLFTIQHRFGRINTGAYNMFGLDQATIRLGLEYGINNRLSIGIGRSTFQKTFDGFLKYKVLRQSEGAKNMPVSLSYYVGSSVNSLKWADMDIGNRENYFRSRFAYVNQLLIARKFSSSLSLQLMPSYIHKNLVPAKQDKNDIFSLGMGGRIKLSKRVSINGEYFYTPKNQISSDFQQPLSIGIDIETGGHVFQLHFSNAQAFFDNGYLTQAQGKWSKGDIYFGFNISRVFTLKKPVEFDNE